MEINGLKYGIQIFIYEVKNALMAVGTRGLDKYESGPVAFESLEALKEIHHSDIEKTISIYGTRTIVLKYLKPESKFELKFVLKKRPEVSQELISEVNLLRAQNEALQKLVSELRFKTTFGNQNLNRVISFYFKKGYGIYMKPRDPEFEQLLGYMEWKPRIAGVEMNSWRDAYANIAHALADVANQAVGGGKRNIMYFIKEFLGQFAGTISYYQCLPPDKSEDQSWIDYSNRFDDVEEERISDDDDWGFCRAHQKRGALVAEVIIRAWPSYIVFSDPTREWKKYEAYKRQKLVQIGDPWKGAAAEIFVGDKCILWNWQDDALPRNRDREVEFEN